MSKGQTFEGTVTAVKGKMVTIESCGHYLTARMENSVSISIGEKISFVVRANRESRIEIAPLRMGNISMEELVQYKALESAGLEANESNMEVVKGLMKYKMAVNRDTIFHILGYLAKYPKLQAEDVVLMKKIRTHINQVTLFCYKENSRDWKNEILLEVETKHMGMITIDIRWTEEKKTKQKQLYFYFQTETEQSKKLLKEQENQWLEKLQKHNIFYKTEYVSMDDEKNNQIVRQIAEQFFRTPSKNSDKVGEERELYIHKEQYSHYD